MKQVVFIAVGFAFLTAPLISRGGSSFAGGLTGGMIGGLTAGAIANSGNRESRSSREIDELRREQDQERIESLRKEMQEKEQRQKEEEMKRLVQEQERAKQNQTMYLITALVLLLVFCVGILTYVVLSRR